MQWSFQPVGGPWFTAVVVALLLALVAVAPRPRPSARKLWTLRALRFFALLLVLIALLRPTLIRKESKPLEASLLLLIDGSRSMQVADSLGGATRWDALQRMLDDSSGAVAKLADRWDVRAYRFGQEVAEVEISDGRLQLPRSPQAESTALGATLEEALERGGGERLLGVVLLSDGAQRALPPRDALPQIAVRRFVAEQVPLYTATFGRPGSGDRPDLAIEDLTASESAFVKAPTEVTGLLRATGYPNRPLTVQLLWENEQGEMIVVDSMRIDSGPQGGGFPFRLEHTPLESGEHKVSVRVEPQEGELITSNNQRSTFITVRDGGVKVLQLVGAQRTGGTPGLEQRFVRAALAASPDIVVTRRVFDYRQQRQKLRLNETGAEPDVVLLDNLDTRALDPRAWRDLAAAVRRGAGLAMLGGYHSFGPGGYASTPLAEVLPVQVERSERQQLDAPIRRDVHLPGPLRMLPAKPLGAGHPIMQIGAETTLDWNNLPLLDGANRFDRAALKANALVLAETADGKPLLVVGQSGAGRVLASAVDQTFRWRIEGFKDPHRRFWRQAVLWLAKKDDNSQNPVWIELDSRRVARGGRLDLRVGARPTTEGDIERVVRFETAVQTPDGRNVELATGGGWEASALFTDTTVPGDYTARVVAFDGDKEIGVAEARFSVPDQDLELDNPAAEPSLMAQLAATTSLVGGRAIAPEELPDLLADFADQQPELEEEVIARVTYWDTWPFFLLLVALLGIEWFLRKRWGLV